MVMVCVFTLFKIQEGVPGLGSIRNGLGSIGLDWKATRTERLRSGSDLGGDPFFATVERTLEFQKQKVNPEF